MNSYSEISLTKVKSGRKEYRCEWCDQKILTGEEHVRRVYKMEGDIRNERMHPECYVAMERSDHAMISEGWMPGDPTRGRPLR